ncbi:MAG: hypothetical protein M3337_05695 [Actinomycetota bacterium]|nr:hypothetical protein [Actinomycetota bacterium]
MLPEFPYFGYGYSATLVPAFRLFDDPEQLFVAVKVTNALLLASVFPLLVVFCRRVLQVGRWPAVAGGLAGALVPGAIAHSSVAVAENVVLPLVVIAGLSCWAMLTDRPGWAAAGVWAVDRGPVGDPRPFHAGTSDHGRSAGRRRRARPRPFADRCGQRGDDRSVAARRLTASQPPRGRALERTAHLLLRAHRQRSSRF